MTYFPTKQPEDGSDLTDLARMKLAARRKPQIPQQPMSPGGPGPIGMAPRAPSAQANLGQNLQQTVNQSNAPRPTTPTPTQPPPKLMPPRAQLPPTVANLGGRMQQPAPSSTPADGGTDLTDLARLKLAQQQQTKAAQDQLAADKAKALQGAAARAGLGGFGLSGAAGAQQSDISRTQDRTAVQSLGDLQNSQADEQFKLIQRQAALDDLELKENADLDGDGDVGGNKGAGWGTGDPNTEPASKNTTPGTQLAANEALFANGSNGGGSGKDNDPYGGIGGASSATLEQIASSGTTFDSPRAETGAVNGEKYVVVHGSDGNWYKFKVDGTGWGNTPSDDDALKWFAQHSSGSG